MKKRVVQLLSWILADLRTGFKRKKQRMEMVGLAFFVAAFLVFFIPLSTTTIPEVWVFMFSWWTIPAALILLLIGSFFLLFQERE